MAVWRRCQACPLVFQSPAWHPTTAHVALPILFAVGLHALQVGQPLNFIQQDLSNKIMQAIVF